MSGCESGSAAEWCIGSAVAGALFLLDIADTATVIGHVVLRSAAAASTFIALSAYPASAADLRLVAAMPAWRCAGSVKRILSV